jgi:drug/metabolite transporter (DMT)-like permease
MHVFDMIPYPGEFSALMAAVCWTITALSFEYAGKRVGSFSVNLLRLIFALVFFSVHGYFFRGMIFPLDASPFIWKWMSISGLVGFCVGDLCLFKAFVVVGSRISMLIMSIVPPLTALIGWWYLGERLGAMAWLGMALTVGGIIMVVSTRHNTARTLRNIDRDTVSKGVLYALGGAAGQAVGLVISKYGMQSFDAVAATHIRVIAGTIGFMILFTFSRQWFLVKPALLNRTAMYGILTGSLFGPFLGVTFSLLAVQNTETGIASTIMAIVPVLIIPPAILLFKEKPTAAEIVGAILSVMGVSLLFL